MLINDPLAFKNEFIHACGNGDLEIVKSLYKKFDLTIIDNFPFFEETLNFGINDAIENEHLNIVKYLVEENFEDFKIGGILDAGSILNTACLYDQRDIVKYIFDKNKIKDLNLDIDDAFKTAYDFAFIEIVELFVFDYNIPVNDTVRKCLQMNHSGIEDEVKSMFNRRNLNQQLSDELKSNTEDHACKKMKI